MDINNFAIWSAAILSVIAILGHLKTFFGSGEAANAKKLDAIEKKLIDHDRRIQAVEGEMKHMPSKDMVNDIRLAMADMKGTVGTLTETLASVSRTVHRIDDYLREEAK